VTAAPTAVDAGQEPAAAKRPRPAAVQIKRVYDEPSDDDGVRVLVDRLWPRGIAKGALVHDDWLRDIAPTTELRRWYHESGTFREFRRRYRAELEIHADVVAALRVAARKQGVTLLTASRQPEKSHAAVLRDLIKRERRSAER
jgi:uncharacterized protein YeaO (DUF488 family)